MPKVSDNEPAPTSVSQTFMSEELPGTGLPESRLNSSHTIII